MLFIWYIYEVSESLVIFTRSDNSCDRRKSHTAAAGVK